MNGMMVGLMLCGFIAADGSSEVQQREKTLAAAREKQKQLQSQESAAREVLTKAATAAAIASQETLKAEADYKVALAQDAAARTANLRKLAEQASAEVQAAEAEQREAERIAQEASKKAAGIKIPESSPLAIPPSTTNNAPPPVNNVPPTSSTLRNDMKNLPSIDASTYVKRPIDEKKEKTAPKIDPKVDQKTDAKSASQKTELAPYTDPKRALIKVKVPVDADVFFAGVQTSSTGSEREYITPVLDNESTFDIRVSSDSIKSIRYIAVKPGYMYNMDFTK